MLLCAATWIGLSAQARAFELSGDFDTAEASATDEMIATQFAPEVVQGVPEADPAPAGNCAACSQCGECGECGCCGCGGGGGGGLLAGLLGGAYSERRPVIAGYGFSGWDNFRGVSDGQFQGNNGFVNGFNVAAPLCERLGLAWQGGMSYGAYDLSGRSFIAPFNQTQQQFFVTTGFFRRADVGSPISGGIVYDWNINNNYGELNNSPTLGQWRGQIAWALGPMNEIGMFGTLRDRGDQKVGAFGVQDYRAISQGNIFWHHKYAAFGGDSWFYVGVPDRHRLAQDPGDFFASGSGGSLGQVIFGTNWLVPVTDYVSVYANGMYMKPSAHPGLQFDTNGNLAIASNQEFWNIAIGVAIYPGGAARSRTVAGRKWMPYLPVANNSTFLVDTNKSI
jgi:hypothetical protein